MPRPWTLIESCSTAEGGLDLHRRGDDEYMISIAGRVLMSSRLHRTELAVAELGCAPIAHRPAPRVLIGGLGLGYTLRAALDALPSAAHVTVAELTPKVVEWCRGPLGPLTDGAIEDARVHVYPGDVTEVIRHASPDHFDAIILDLYEGPRDLPRGAPDPLYGGSTLRAVGRALRTGGVYSVWAEEPNQAFERRLAAEGLTPQLVRCGGRGPRHAVYVATNGAEGRSGARSAASGRARRRGRG